MSIDDTKNIINIIKKKYPKIIGPDLNDICYVTQNRQVAVSSLAENSDLVLVIGAENSSNTKRLAEIVKKKNIRAYRISNVNEIQKDWLTGINTIGITAGASSPEILISEVINFLKEIFEEINIETMEGVKETIKFKPLLKFT